MPDRELTKQEREALRELDKAFSSTPAADLPEIPGENGQSVFDPVRDGGELERDLTGDAPRQRAERTESSALDPDSDLKTILDDILDEVREIKTGLFLRIPLE